MSYTLSKISIRLAELQEDPTTGFDAIVVGSGYGGSVAAARLARAGRRVLLLERGREILPGQYPRTMTEARSETQVSTAKRGPLNKRNNGMVDIRINKDVHVILGCGLGGGSLINANVSVETDPRVMTSDFWPDVFHDAETLAPYYQMAREMLGATPLPDIYNPHKLRALKTSADELGYTFERPPLNVTFKAGKNAVGVHQDACTMCGDCCSGCNYGAKNTTLMNYLPDAACHGARIVTEVSVRRLSQTGDGKWRVHATDISDEDERQAVFEAETVVLAAGTLGSTEILLRSTGGDDPIPIAANNLGKRFSGNGDVLGFGFDANYTHEVEDEDKVQPIYGIGAGRHDPDKPEYWPGPCISGMIKINMGEKDTTDKALVIEEGVAPGALSAIYPGALFFDSSLSADFTRFPDTARRLTGMAELGGDMTGPRAAYHGSVSRTQTYLIMSHDDSGGRIEMNPDTDCVYINWPGVGTDKPYTVDSEIMRSCADAIWANYLQNPLSTEKFGSAIITVHPVGGCVMADHAADGVVNADCRVFTGEGDTVHDGLLVCDGAVMPTSLGLNPLLTITAVAERAMARLIEAHGWSGQDRVLVEKAKPDRDAQQPDFVAIGKKVDDLLASIIDRLDSYVQRINDGASDVVAAEIRKLCYGIIAETGYNELKKFFARIWVRRALRNADWKADMAPALAGLQGYFTRIRTALRGAEPDQYEIAKALDVIEEIAGDISPGVSFSELMTGHLARPSGRETKTISDPFEISARMGRSLGQKAEGHFNVTIDSIAQLHADVLDDASPYVDHIAKLNGTLAIWLPSTKSNEATHYRLQDAHFNMLKQDRAEVDTWKMIYEGALHSDGRKPLHFRGVKTLKRRAGSNWWTDLTQLSVEICDLDASQQAPRPKGNVLYRGIISLSLQDLLVQANTLRSKYKNGAVEALFFDTAHAIGDGVFRNKVAETASGTVKDTSYMHTLVRAVLGQLEAKDSQTELAKALTGLKVKFLGGTGRFFATLLFRAYGGVPAYLSNFPARTDSSKALPAADGAVLGKSNTATSECHWVVVSDDVKVKLIRFNAGSKGPIVLAPGFATKSLCYAMQTTGRPSLVDRLIDADYDVWLFDYRSSPELGNISEQAFTLDDIAQQDWPAAIDYVTEKTGANTVQVLAHCVGAMTAQMALLSGKTSKIRQLIASQLTVHPVTNWFNMMKADSHIAHAIRHGLPANLRSALPSLIGDPEIERLFSHLETINANSEHRPTMNNFKSDQFINMLMWNVPFPYAEPCYSPTCHRIFGVYGPVYAHENLNQDTHNAIKEIFGSVSTAPFEQLALIMRTGYAVSSRGDDIYLPNVARMDLPIHFISGAINQEFLPDTTLKTLHWLQDAMPGKAAQFTRHVYPGYAHLDCFIGKTANEDIFDDLVARLDEYAAP